MSGMMELELHSDVTKHTSISPTFRLLEVISLELLLCQWLTKLLEGVLQAIPLHSQVKDSYIHSRCVVTLYLPDYSMHCRL